MLTRREFAVFLPSALALPLLAGEVQVPARVAPKTSVMMWTLDKLGTFEQNLELVAAAGYRQVELVREYAGWSSSDQSRILGRMAALGVRVDAIAGMKLGFADPSGGDAFLDELQGLVPTARQLGARQIILLSGKRVEERETEQHAASVEVLRRAAPLLASAGLTGVIEPIDRLENPAVYLDGVTEAFEIVQAVNDPAVRVLYDLYHEQRTHGNLMEKLERNLPLIGLIHVADVPGRHEPGTGEIDYPSLYRRLAVLGYAQTIAMEFYPAGDPVATLRAAREQVNAAF